jgi:hypothetical protein
MIEEMKKTVAALFALALTAPLAAYAFTTLPFGGKVIFTEVCDEGLLLTLKTSRGVGHYMWFTGNLPYLSKRVPHLSQNILGIAEIEPIPCTVSGVPYDGGFPILFHGSGS